MPHLVAAIAITCAAVVPQTAAAHSDTLSIDITARIKPRCGFTSRGPMNVAATTDLELAATLKLNVGLDCNAPYVFGVSAQRGALTNRDAHEDGSGYAFEKIYNVALALETDHGVVRSGKCRSSELVDRGRCDFAGGRRGQGLASGKGISVDRNAVLTIDWPAQASLPRRLAPGRYQDTLIFVVRPRG